MEYRRFSVTLNLPVASLREKLKKDQMQDNYQDHISIQIVQHFY